MAISNNTFTDPIPFSATAASALTGGYAGNLDGSASEAFKIDVAGTGERCDGIIMETVASGVAGQLARIGVGKMIVNGATTNIACGDYLKSSSGIGVQAGLGDYCVGIAMEPATTDGAVIDVLIKPGVCEGLQTGTAITTTSASLTVTAAQLNSKETAITVNTAGICTVNLPTVVGLKGRRIRVTRLVSSSVITMDPAGSETIASTIAAAATTNTDLGTINEFAIWEADGVANWMLVGGIFS